MRLIGNQVRNKVSGTLELFRHPSARGSVSGWTDESGTLVVGGTVYVPEENIEGDITKWETTHDAERQKLSGKFTLMMRFTNFWGPQVVKQEYEVVRIVRSPE